MQAPYSNFWRNQGIDGRDPEWSADYLYSIGELAWYECCFYVAITPNTNSQPDTNPTDWEKVFTGDLNWDSDQKYVTGSVVWYVDSFYVSLQESTGDQPDTSPLFWDKQVSAPGTTWSSEATYGIGDLVWYQGFFWESLIDDNLNNTPAEGASWTAAKIEQFSVNERIAGESLTAPIFTYSGTDGKLYIGDNREVIKSFIVGVVPNSAAADEIVYSRLQGKLSGFTGLVPGADYYLGNSGQPITKGSILDGEQIVFLGTAVSTTELDLNIQPPQPANLYVDMPLGTKVTNVISGNAWLLSHGFAQAALDNAISQSVFSALFDKIGHTWNDLHVMAGDADLSGSSTLFYPTPPPTDDGWLTLREELTRITPTLSFTVPNGVYRVRVGRTSSDFYTAYIRVDDQTNLWSGTWRDNYNVDYQAGTWDASASGYGVQRIEKLVPETLSTEGAYAYYKTEAVTPSGEPVSALLDTWERGDATTWGGNTLTVTHSLDCYPQEMDINIQFRNTTDGLGWRTHLEGINSGATFVRGYTIDYDGATLNSFDVIIATNGIQMLNDDGTVSALFDGDTGNMRVQMRKPNLIANYAYAPTVRTITDAVDVVESFPSASELIGERVYERTGSGTGKYTLNCQSGEVLVLQDGTEISSIDLEGEATLKVYARAGKLKVMEFVDNILTLTTRYKKYADGTATYSFDSTTGSAVPQGGYYKGQVTKPNVLTTVDSANGIIAKGTNLTGGMTDGGTYYEWSDVSNTIGLKVCTITETGRWV